MVPNRLKAWGGAAALGAVLLMPAVAHGAFYGFVGITNNHPADVAIGEAQLTLQVTSPAADEVLFTFGNQGPGRSVIEQVFLEKGALDSLLMVIDTPPFHHWTGVDFRKDTKVGNLPGGNSLHPKFLEVFSASAKPPAPWKGVNNTLAGTESVGLLFSLASGKTFDDVLAGLNDGALRVGVHVIAYSRCGGSESFIAVPEPTTLALCLLALGTLGRVRRSRR